VTHEKAYYERIREEETPQAVRLAAYLMDVYQPRSVADFGCADGLYLVPFAEAGVHVIGLDHSPVLREMAQIDNLILTDLRQPYNLGAKVDLTLCLEVLEHIEEQYAERVVENLAASSDLLLVSATEGQGGEGHVNLQPQSYWVDKFAEHGFLCDEEATERLIDYMMDGYYMGWLANNGMILRRTW
jgi:cyclopropane fatty-acyl-phospholipid synthase-like methyltransferase